jgi:phosphoribosylformimino-5-aminoimidazole carboxamide ribotide isomerase
VILPAIDVMAGKVVRLTAGDLARPTAYSDDVAATLRSFAAAGARRVHVVDLDAAAGRGDNGALIASLLGTGPELQVAGGIRDEEAVERWLGAGAAAVVIGTLAVKEARRFQEIARRHPGRVCAALDVRGLDVAVRGWTEAEPIALGAVLLPWEGLPLDAVILTAVERDGTLTGPDIALLRSVRELTGHPVIYSGGIRSLADVAAALEAGAAGVILGKALYEGRVDLRAALAL